MYNNLSETLLSRSKNTNCSVSYCERFIARIDCISQIMQGTTACVDIQLFGNDGYPLNLNLVSNIRLMLFDEIECTVGNFYHPTVPSGETGYSITILHETDTEGNTINNGKINICLNSEVTSIAPGSVFAEMIITFYENATGNTGDYIEETVGIPCFKIVDILPSKIYQSKYNKE